jgi:hypothetical protein
MLLWSGLHASPRNMRILRLTLSALEESDMHARLFRLLEKHQSIDEALRLEQRRPSPNWSELFQLKRHKLRVKDLIHRSTRRGIQA